VLSCSESTVVEIRTSGIFSFACLAVYLNKMGCDFESFSTLFPIIEFVSTPCGISLIPSGVPSTGSASRDSRLIENFEFQTDKVAVLETSSRN